MTLLGQGRPKWKPGLTLMLALPKSPNDKLRIDAIFCIYIQALLYSDEVLSDGTPIRPIRHLF